VASPYTIKDLCREAESRGFKVSPRLIVDWVSLGLLDRPGRRGLGRGKGSVAMWPEDQRQLFLTLLEQRKHRTKQIVGLCNVPVAVWLLWGDTYIPLRQVQRALRTWAQAAFSSSWGGARKAATHLLDQVGHPRARPRDRRALLEALSRMTYQRNLDGNVLLPLLQRVFDPRGTETPRGPLGTTPADIVALLQSRYEAITHLGDIDDSTFEWARFVYVTSWQHYLRERPRLAAGPDLGNLHEEPDLERLFNRACLDLITLLGMAQARFKDTLAGTLLHPTTWRERHLHTTVTRTEVTPSGVNIALQVSAGEASTAQPHADSSAPSPSATGGQTSKQEEPDARPRS
jgi:hypothetical protein